MKIIVEAAGLTMAHVVYTQVYLSDASDEGPLNRVWMHYFPKSPPAGSNIGTARLLGSPVEMSALPAMIEPSGRRPPCALPTL